MWILNIKFYKKLKKRDNTLSNISKEKRNQMIGFLDKLRKNNEDDEILKEIDKIENALMEKNMD